MYTVGNVIQSIIRIEDVYDDQLLQVLLANCEGTAGNRCLVERVKVPFLIRTAGSASHPAKDWSHHRRRNRSSRSDRPVWTNRERMRGRTGQPQDPRTGRACRRESSRVPAYVSVAFWGSREGGDGVAQMRRLVGKREQLADIGARGQVESMNGERSRIIHIGRPSLWREGPVTDMQGKTTGDGLHTRAEEGFERVGKPIPRNHGVS